jgi:DNA-binding beta-propeller fold protein YncE
MKKTACAAAMAAIACTAGIVMLALPLARPARPVSGDGGPATAAAINGPCSIVVDGSQTLYVVEYFHVIRRVDLSSGIIGTVHTQEPLESISALALDPAGDLIVVEADRVHKVSVRDGSVRDIVGGGIGFGGDGGPAALGELELPEGAAFDRAGNLYIADTSNHRVRRVDASTGIITTVAGNGRRNTTGDGGPATQASLEYPGSVAVGADGDLFISQSGYTPDRGCIRRVDGRTGIIQTIAGLGVRNLAKVGMPAREAKLESPNNVALDRDGSLLFIERTVARVCRIDVRTGILRTIAGTVRGFSGDGGLATRAKLIDPGSIALDSNGNLFIADFVSNRVRRVDARTGAITTVAGNGLPHRIDILM